MQQKILMLKGLPGSGKSTWAKKIIKDNPQYKRINKDDLRKMVDGGKYSFAKEQFIINLRDEFIYAAIEMGYSVIVDDGNLHPKHETRLRDIAEKSEVDFEIKFFDVDLKTCIKRDLQRTESVGEKIIKSFYKQFIKKQPEKYVPPSGAPKAIIVDVDGTLAKCGDRDVYDGAKAYLFNYELRVTNDRI